MNFKYGNSNSNLMQNIQMNNNINNQSNFVMNHNIGNNNSNYNPINILLQYINLMNSKTLNNNQGNQNNFNNDKVNNHYFNNNINSNSSNFFQLMPNMPNILKYGFNQPYTLSNTKKESSIIHPSNFKNKLFYKNKNQYSNHLSDNNLNDNKSEDDYNERKFMRKMTKAEKIEIDKWFEARKKLYPTKKNIELKKQLGQIKVEKGLVSDLELKLRKKVNILKKLNSSKRIKIRNKFNKEFPNFQIRKKEKNEQKNKNNEINSNNIQSNSDETKKIEYILEEGEIVESINEEDKKEDKEEKDINKNNLTGRKRERKMNKIKNKLGKNKKSGKENKNEFGFKKGFKYKSNNLYEELIKKDKIKEQNILLQAIRYLINLKEEQI